MCLEFHINTPLKICSNCVWFLSSSSRGYITTSKHVYCLKINSVDRKPLWDKHDPYVLVLHFRRISILMWLCLHTVQFDYSFLCFLRQNRNRMNRKCVLSTRLLNSINDWLACLDKQGTFFFFVIKSVDDTDELIFTLGKCTQHKKRPDFSSCLILLWVLVNQEHVGLSSISG